MKIVVYQDNTLSLDLESMSKNFVRIAPNITVLKGKANFELCSPIKYPESYTELPAQIVRDSETADVVLVFTRNQYDNNYFWEGLDNLIIISLFAWEHLTKIPRNNGAAFFVCAILTQTLKIGVRHEENTGCINDFWMDKTGVDLGMRTGSICQGCLVHHRKHKRRKHELLLGQIQDLLKDIGSASRNEIDISEHWKQAGEKNTFDVFLCHNTDEKTAVRKFNARLKKRGLVTWLDEEQLRPGQIWQVRLEKEISQIKAVAVFVGESGFGPWQNMEIYAFLSEFAKQRCPIIPVILKECTEVPTLPLFLRQFTWVDCRKKYPDPFAQLVWGITGRKD